MQDISEIYRQYGEIVYKYILCLTGNTDLAEEIMQETFVVAVKDIHKFRGDCKISTWLCQIAKFLWYKKFKKEKTHPEVSLEELQNSLFLEDSLEENLSHQEDKIQLFKAFHRLDEDTRNVMYLRIFGNFNYAEIGEIMNRTANWARIVFFRGKQKLKEELNQ